MDGIKTNIGQRGRKLWDGYNATYSFLLMVGRTKH